jgi:hypothetical protein
LVLLIARAQIGCAIQRKKRLMVKPRHDGYTMIPHPRRYSLHNMCTGMPHGQQRDTMSASTIQPFAARHWQLLRTRGAKAFGVFSAIVLLLCTSLLVALETPSKPFLEKNSFYLSSAGFRVRLANDPAGQKALRAMPPYRFVMHKFGDDVRYLYAEPQYCVCIFVGTRQNYQDYRDILSRPLPQVDDVSPDYKTQAGALLYGDPYDFNSLDEPDSLAEYFRDYY